MKRVGFWSRVAASLLDMVFVLPVWSIFIGAIYYLHAQGQLTPRAEYLLGVSAAATAVAYSSFEVFKAGTPGKLALGYRIGSGQGKPAETSRLVQRWLAKNSGTLIGLVGALVYSAGVERVSGIINVIILLGFLRALGEEKQALHDKVADTAVYRVKDLVEVPGFQPLVSPLPVQQLESSSPHVDDSASAVNRSRP